jgi:1-phosphofructokinase family hexose kinase
MIVTVTLNTAIDRIYFIEDFVWNQTIRASKYALGMGGKATDASWILGELGYKNCAMGFAGGIVGQQMEKMLKDRGCDTDFVWVNGETRTAIIVISESGKGQSTLVSGGLDVEMQDVDNFRNKYSENIKNASCLIIGGSVPPGLDPSIYTELIEEANQENKPVVFDASGPGLKSGLAGHPTIAKPNLDEISYLVGRKVSGLSEIYQEARKLKSKYGTDFIITLGSEGALAVLEQQSYLIPALKIPVVNTAGAGDGVLAGISTALAAGKPIEEGLQKGFAAAAAVCLTPATADCHKKDVEKLESQVKLIPYP